MVKECSVCKSKVSYRDFYKQTFKNNYKFTCNNCETKYKSTGFSRFVSGIIYFGLIYYLISYSDFSLGTNILISILYVLFFHSFILKYRVVEE